MDQNELDQQSQHWEKSFSNRPEMFGLEHSTPAKKALKFFKEKKINNVIELGAGLGRDSIFFAKNNIKIQALDYSSSGIKIINQKINKRINPKYQFHFTELLKTIGVVASKKTTDYIHNVQKLGQGMETIVKYALDKQ